MALREARLEKNYTQEYLAELLNITPTHMKHIESGHRKPSIEVYFKMVEVLGFSTDSFLLKEASAKTETARRELAHARRFMDRQLYGDSRPSDEPQVQQMRHGGIN